MKPVAPFVVFAALLTLVPAQAQDAVVVRFVDAELNADAGHTPWLADANRADLARHLQALGQRHLKSGEQLTLTIRDVDLAGTVIHSPRRLAEIRVAHGRADWPRVVLHYRLSRDGATLAQGEDAVTDLDYQRPIRGALRSVDLAAEKRMLTQWFEARFAAQAPPAAARP